MAFQNRNERQLMRQRGAGRDVAPTNFGLSFSFDAGRPDRQQMRQRGGASRKVDNINFGLNFPTPGSRRSRSATPQYRVSNATSQPKVIARQSRELSHSRRQRSVSAAPDAEAANPAKRQRISAQTGTSYNAAEAFAARRQQSSLVFPVVEDAEEQEPVLAPLGRQNIVSAQDAMSSLVTHDELGKEKVVSKDGKAVRKRRKKRSIIPAGLRKKKRLSRASTISDLQDLNRRQDSPQLEPGLLEQDELPETRESTPKDLPARSAIARESSLIPPEGDLVSIPENSPDETTYGPTEEQQAGGMNRQTKKRRKKRKSVVLVKPRKRISQGSAPSVVAGPSSLRERSASLVPFESQQMSHRSSEVEDDVEPCRPVRRRPPRETAQASGTSPLLRRDTEEGSEEEYNPDDYSPEPETPAPRKKLDKARLHLQPRQQSDDAAEDRSKKRKKESFPITTHRLNNAGALPAIDEEGEAERGDGEHRQYPNSTFTDHANPNSTDVLAQICREVIDAAVQRLPETRDKTIKHKRKRDALEAFGNDLDDRLFDMSNVVENRITLEARVRKAKRQKSDLQVQWIEVRKQRERMALKCDRVRKYHWDNEREREDKWQISEAAQTAELELGRGEGAEEESLEFLLKSVAEDVSGKGHMGLLDRIKLFNGQLERMAGVLGGRT